jgi:hypothetical protein
MKNSGGNEQDQQDCENDPKLLHFAVSASRFTAGASGS